MKYKVKNNNPLYIKQISEDLDIPKEIANLLISRGYKTPEEALDFLLAEQELSDPFGLPDMDKLCERIYLAIKNKERISICGDYDVDGTLATTILTRFLRSCGADVNYFIPDRQKHGYGLGPLIVEELKKNNTAVIISVDTGTTAFEAADKAKELGIDLIVSDHHNLSDKGLPDVYALVNAKRLEDKTNLYSDLAGSGVAYFIIRALNTFLSKKGREKIDELDYEVLAMIATIADVMPLTNNNRLIVKNGLKKIRMTSIPGLSQLIEKKKLYDPNAKDIAFQIAPTLNAAGRIGSAEDVLKLFLEDNKIISEILKENIVKLNAKRKKISDLVAKEALEIAAATEEKPMAYIIDGDFHEGVIGIAAAKVSEKFHRPTAIISRTSIPPKGSCRTIPGFNVKEALDYCQDLLLAGGGHDMAAGFSIELENIEEFKIRFNKFFSEHKAVEKEIVLDLEMDALDISKDFIKLISLMEPFGQKNPFPLVKINNCMPVVMKQTRSRGLFFVFSDVFKAIQFSALPEHLEANIKNMDLVGEIVVKSGEIMLQIQEIIVKNSN